MIGEEQELTAYNSITFGNSLSLRVDEGVGAMTISPSGRDVALASRSGLFVIDLDDPFSPPRWLHHATTWEVADVQWSPHAAKPSWVVSTSNQKALVWNLALPSSHAVEYVLHAHQRAITDINFHGFEPEIIGTCSVDSFVHVWDLRQGKRPVQSFADWTAGATQLKWNRRNPHVLASAHDRKVYIWDDRKGSIPLHVLEGHRGKVNGLDFSREDETKILTCSNDRTVKLWSYEEDDKVPEYTIETAFPIWRARHTPFGVGCVIMPLRGGNNTVFMQETAGLKGTVKKHSSYEFRGHSEPIKEFVWRTRGGNTDVEDREFQLVTWSKDHDLRLWPVSQDVLEEFHYKSGQSLTQRITRKGTPYRTFRDEPFSPVGSNGFVRRRRPQGFVYGVSPDGRSSLPGSFNKATYMTGAATPGGYRYQRGQNSHLRWISGVRMGRSAFAAPFDNNLGDEIAGDQSEATPGNLGEEVSIVGHKFPRVRFEKISVSTGECVVSLNGPWGSSDNDLIFLRVEIKFPNDYPWAAPQYHIEEGSKIAPETVVKISDELKNISTKLSERGRYSLELCLRYLLGDKVSIEEEDDFRDLMVRKDSVVPADSTEDLTQTSNEFAYSSSSSDEDDLARTKIPRNLSDHAAPAKPSFDSTPVPKGCGAVWSKSGELVCFFTHKEKRKNLSGSGFLDRQKLSIGGGALKLTTGSSDSSGSEDSYEESDPEEFLDGASGLTNQWPTTTSRYRASLRIGPFARPGSETMSNTDRSHGGTVKGDQRERNIVKIYDFRHLIPARRDLALEYRILGDTPQALARHNAVVAEKFGYFDVADCWRLIEFVISADYQLPPPERLQIFRGNSNLMPLKDGSFAWGDHPFGKSWLIDQLFDYFERVKDTQMLANMSCVLSGCTMQNKASYQAVSKPIMLLSAAGSDGSFDIDGTSQSLSSALGGVASRGSSANYFGLLSNNTPNPASDPTSAAVATPAVIAAASAASTGNSFFANTRGQTAPWDIPHKASSVNAIDESSPVSSSKDDASIISLSPEKFISAKKAVVNLFSRNYNSNSKPPSTTTKFLRRRINSSSSLKSAHHHQHPHHTEEELTELFGPPGKRLSTISGFGSELGTEFGFSMFPKINIEIFDEEMLTPYEDVEGRGSYRHHQLLLSPEKKLKYEAYRTQYANILYSWGLSVASLEVLKFNCLSSSHSTAKSPASALAILDRTDLNSAQIQYRSYYTPKLDGEVLYGTTEDMPAGSYSQICHYCHLMVKTRFVQCQDCEHILHADCAGEWWEFNENICVSGCGCVCSNYIYF
ncbi:maintenance of telomere capping protein 5 [Trichomonascus vanleenenianus]|uniref:Mtc5p n=1 Tax=Trichomonascus vanleenenianus TaxID=2268995 RepID=UPI003ECB629E